jgi:adenylate cyclase
VKAEDVGRELGVQYVLEGSVRRASDRVRITAQLIDATTGLHLWSDRYDRELSDIFALQDEVVQEIVDALQVEVHHAQFERIRRKPTENLSAYDTYLRGMSHLLRFTRKDNAEAQHFLERAIELDPNFADAHATLAVIENNNGVFGWDRDPELLDRVSSHTQRALALDPLHPAAHMMIALLAVERGSPDAVAAVERAVELGPQSSAALSMLASVRARQGRMSEARELTERVMRLDPGSAISLMFRAGQEYGSGRVESAIALWERARTIAPDNLFVLIFLGDAYETSGRHEDARQMVQEILGVRPDSTSETVVEFLSRFRALGGLDPQPIAENLRRAGLP